DVFADLVSDRDVTVQIVAERVFDVVEVQADECFQVPVAVDFIDEQATRGAPMLEPPTLVDEHDRHVTQGQAPGCSQAVGARPGLVSGARDQLDENRPALPAVTTHAPHQLAQMVPSTLMDLVQRRDAVWGDAASPATGHCGGGSGIAASG